MGRAGKMRVYAFTAWTPRYWPIVPVPNGNRQRSALVAAPSIAAALRAFAEAGVRITPYEFRNYGNPDVAGPGSEQALACPGRVFYRPSTTGGEYVPVPDALDA